MMNDNLSTYIVLYREKDSEDWLYDPLVFICAAEDTAHAEEQCDNAYPDCDIVWVYRGDDVEEAFSDYYGVNEE